MSVDWFEFLTFCVAIISPLLASLLARKSYEMQMFHMSSLKMGLDQVVLKGFETGSSSEVRHMT